MRFTFTTKNLLILIVGCGIIISILVPLYWYARPNQSIGSNDLSNDLALQKALSLVKDSDPTPQEAQIQSTDSPARTSSVVPLATALPMQPSITPSPNFTISVADPKTSIEEGETMVWSWVINGPLTDINKTIVYGGTTSNYGVFDTTKTPSDTSYSEYVSDFSNGTYTIPLWFTGKKNMTNQGTYFYRLYAYINGKHVWSEEKKLVVTPLPKNAVELVGEQKDIYKGDTATITWDIVGPQATIQTTAVLVSTQSIAGEINSNVPPENTPYDRFIGDFTNGSYNIPLRFVGNARVETVGKYYYRAYAYINGKNYWSAEKSFTVL